MMDFFPHQFEGWLPTWMEHGRCVEWAWYVLAPEAIGNIIISACYFLMPGILFYVLRKRPDLPPWFHQLCRWACSFVISCGMTHVMDLWNIWHGHYLMAAVITMITAAVSVRTLLLVLKYRDELLLFARVAAIQAEIKELKKEVGH